MAESVATVLSVEEEANRLICHVLSDPDGRANPYPHYRRLREIAPVHHSVPFGTWLLTRYDDVDRLLRDNSAGRDAHRFMGSRYGADWDDHPALRRMTRTMLWKNPPDHTRLRRLVTQVFSARRTAALRATIESIVQAALDPIAAAGGGDIVNDVAFPIPLQVISAVLGVPEAEAGDLRDPLRDAQRTLELGCTPQELADADLGAQIIEDYFQELVDARRAHPRDDLLSALIATSDADGARLSGAELIGMCNVLMGGGFETTTHMIGNGLLALLHHPDQEWLLRQDPGLLPTALDEILRFDPPVQVTARWSDTPLAFGGTHIPAGSTVTTVLAAANRDPERFSHPDRFDITRKEARPLSFGAGIHHCLGWSLAKLEGEITFEAILRRFTRIELAEPPEYRPRFTMRGLDSLRVRVECG